MEDIRTINTGSIPKQLHGFLQQAPMAICVFRGADHTVEMINRRMLKIWGRTFEDVIHKPVFVAMPDTSGQGYEQILDNVYKTGQRFTTEEQSLTIFRNGKTENIFVKFTCEPYEEDDGTISGVIAVADEITDQVYAQKKAGESEQQYRNLLRELPVAVYTTDIQGLITFYNKAAIELWGREPQIGKDLWCGSWKIYNPDGTILPLDECPMAILLKERKKILGREIVIERPDGEKKTILPHPEPIYDYSGNMIGAVNMLIDVSERKTNEKNIAMLAAIVQSSDDAIISKTVDKSIITSWNNAAERIFGYTAEEMIGQSVLKLIPEDKLDDEPLILEKIKKGDRVEHYETKRIKKDGTLIDVSLSVSPIKDSSGYIIGASKIARDITGQKETARRIKESEERMRMASESLHLGTWEFHPLTGKLLWSDECKRIYGVPLNFQPDNDFVNAHHFEEDREMIHREIWKASNPDGDGNFHLQYRITRHDNKQLRWLNVQGKMFFTNDKKAERFIGTMLDITDQKNREQKLVNSIELFQTMADNVPAMIWMSGTDKFNDYFNKTWLEFTGRTLDQESNEGWLSGLHPDDVKRCVDTYNRSLKNQKAFYSEYRLRRHDGEYRWIADNSIPRFSAEGDFLGFISACMDIDDQKRFREKILANELLFKTISNAAPVGLWMTDTNGQNTFVNATWEEWTGIPGEKQLGTGWLDRVLEEDKVNAPAKFQEVLQKEIKYTTEFRIRRKDGEIRWCLTEGYPYYDTNGELAGYAGSVTDITDMKKMEQRKDDFIKMASHELKTPITSINGYVQLLLNIYNEFDDEKLQASRGTVRSSLGTVAKQVSKLTRLISDLLDMSKIESDKLELQQTEFDLSKLIEETVQDMRYATSHHAIVVQNDFEGNIYGDKDRLAQVLTNLLNNAIKYSPDANKVDVYTDYNNNAVNIHIRDYGIGIDKGEHKKIFERFYRVGGKAEQTYPGFGIGLFIASEIIHRHNGTISVKSQKNKGSIFTLSLPVKP